MIEHLTANQYLFKFECYVCMIVESVVSVWIDRAECVFLFVIKQHVCSVNPAAFIQTPDYMRVMYCDL